MIVVTKVEVVVCSGADLALRRPERGWDRFLPEGFDDDLDIAPVPLEVMEEHVRGRKFRNYRGRTVCIGMTAEAQDALGMPFEAFEGQEEAIASERIENMRLLGRIRYARSTPWRRLRFLATGKME